MVNWRKKIDAALDVGIFLVFMAMNHVVVTWDLAGTLYSLIAKAIND